MRLYQKKRKEYACLYCIECLENIICNEYEYKIIQKQLSIQICHHISISNLSLKYRKEKILFYYFITIGKEYDIWQNF